MLVAASVKDKDSLIDV